MGAVILDAEPCRSASEWQALGVVLDVLNGENVHVRLNPQFPERRSRFGTGACCILDHYDWQSQRVSWHCRRDVGIY